MAPPQSRNAAKSNHKGKRRHFSSPEEIQQQLNRLHMKDDDIESGDNDSDSDEDEDDEDSDDSSDEFNKKTWKPKGVSNLIEIENPNRNPKPIQSDEVQLSRREREELQKQQAKERYQKLQAEGKTDQAKADLARLELIRKQRQEANLKREMERKEKELNKLNNRNKSNSAVAPSSSRK